MISTQLDDALSKFVIKIRKQNGKEYARVTLHNIVSALLRLMRDNGLHENNFLDTQDIRFVNFRKKLDARLKQLTSKGIGTEPQQADPITAKEEEILWNKGQLGAGTSQSLINTVFYYNCKLFGLRGMDEHRSLSCDQYTFGETSDGLIILFYHSMIFESSEV